MQSEIENPFRMFWDLGYTRLVTVVPPNAELSERSALSVRLKAGDDSRGKVPGRRGHDGKWYGLKAWQHEETDPDFFDQWFAWGASCGLVMGDGLVAVDIDTLDKAASKTIYEAAKRILGPASPRIGNFPKLLMLYAITQDVPFRKIKFKTATEDSAHVELMTAGKQFVAYGTHPKTGKPYDWPSGAPARSDLTEITPEQLDDFFAAVGASFEGVQDITTTGADRALIDQETLKGNPETLRSAMRDLPNRQEDFPSRDSYLLMACALKAGFGPKDEAEALDLFLQWCGRWDNGTNDPQVAEADFNRLHPPFAIGADYIYNKAETISGWTGRAQDFFTPQDMDGEPEHLTPKPAQEGYRIESISDVMNRQLPKFLLEDYLPQQGFGLLYGAPGCGKSFIALDMALHIAYGLDDWHGKSVTATSRKVLYIAGEGASGFKPRILAWQTANADRIKGKTPEIGFLFQPVNFMRPEDIRRLVQAAKAMGDEWAFVVVDTVSRAIPGADENLQKDMTIFVHACDALRHAMSGFVLGVHHTSKAGAMRGSSVFSGQADAVFKLSRRQGAILSVDMFCEKQKDAKDNWTEAFRLIETTAETENTSSLVPVKMKEGDPAAGPSVMDVGLQNMLLQAMDTAWKSGSPWSKNPRAKENFAPRVISRDFGLCAEEAAVLVDMWERTGLISFDVADRKSKRKGYKVVGFVTQAGSDGADDTSGFDDNEGVFE